MSDETSFGRRIFEHLGCHPKAIEENKERSETLWILAGHFARYWQDQDVNGVRYGGWPSIFWAENHRPPDPPFFLSGIAKLDHNVKLDGITLQRWLNYARRRLDTIRDYGFFLLMIGQGQPLPMRRLMMVWERSK